MIEVEHLQALSHAVAGVPFLLLRKEVHQIKIQALFYSSILIILLLVASMVGCQQQPVSTPAPVLEPTPDHAPTPTPTPKPTPEPVIVIPTTTVEVVKDIEYGRAGDIPLLLDIYIPETPVTKPMPAVIWIHGGSWRRGDKSSGIIKKLASRGFFGVSINYRLSGIAPFPAALEDSKCAVRWLRANAETYNVDPDRIGVWGGSAGGHLAMMVACADETAGLEGNGAWAEFSSQVQAACSYYGHTDLLSMYKQREENRGSVEDIYAPVKFLGCHPEENPEIWRTADPINHVTADDPPLLMIHGELDQIVSITQSEQMYEAYQQAGLEATLVRVREAGHVFKQVTDKQISPSIEEIDQVVLEFFVEHLLRTR